MVEVGDNVLGRWSTMSTQVPHEDIVWVVGVKGTRARVGMIASPSVGTREHGNLNGPEDWTAALTRRMLIPLIQGS